MPNRAQVGGELRLISQSKSGDVELEMKVRGTSGSGCTYYHLKATWSGAQEPLATVRLSGQAVSLRNEIHEARNLTKKAKHRRYEFRMIKHVMR